MHACVDWRNGVEILMMQFRTIIPGDTLYTIIDGVCTGIPKYIVVHSGILFKMPFRMVALFVFSI